MSSPASPHTPPVEPWNDLPLPELCSRLTETGLIRRLLELARDEDLGPAGIDLTGQAVRAESSDASVDLTAREPGVCAGLAFLPELLSVFDADVAFRAHIADGDTFSRGDRLATFEGPIAEIVRVERTILNLASRLSGIATRTAAFVQAMRRAGDHPARLYDTRKTTPGLRVPEKYAVRCGGGCCHRFGLHDAVMFKDNHIAGVPDDRLAAHAAELAAGARAGAATAGIVPVFIEFEVDTLGQLDALLTLEPGAINIVLLDNMTTADMTEAVRRRDQKNAGLSLEASGGVGIETIASIAATGVDRISVGGLTHQAVSLDLGFDRSE